MPGKWIALCLSLCLSAAAPAVLTDQKTDDKAVGDAQAAMKAFDLQPGIVCNVWAAEPLLKNPVTFCIDEHGLLFVGETERFEHGVTDNRHEGYWLNDDLATHTVEERLAYQQKWADKHHPMSWYTEADDRIRLVIDTDHDGKADTSTIFADKFNGPIEGIGAGLLAHDGDIYYADIPNLWLLRDSTGDNKADVRQSLHQGFGVRTSFLGHDMHGLAMGPDGKIYFSIGDRGYNVPLPNGKRLYDTMDIGRGAVFRCNFDGSALEVVYTGLRNPQELAFDQYGDLFTGDNNSDAGDKSRIVYIAEGGDSGWMMSFQYMGGKYNRGPWHEEKIWHLRNDDQPAWVLPPIAHVADGPSGFVYYPGVGLSDRYNEHFFLADFRGSPGPSGIRSFKLDRDGAGFKIEDQHQFAWHILATDVDFGYDGRMYISDWINGWSGTGKGRIYTLHDEKAIQNPIIQQTVKLFDEGFAKQSSDALVKLLEYPDMRVRLRAQFTLADRNAADLFVNVATTCKNELARLHGIWGLGQIGQAERIASLLGDPDAEVRAQAAKVMGENHVDSAGPALVKMLEDESLRVRYFAALSLGKLRFKPALEPVVKMIRDNDNKDLFLRHAGIMALVWIGDSEVIGKYASDESAAVRMAMLLAMRRFDDPRLAMFLHDHDEAIVTEAARAIYDRGVAAAMPALAKIIDQSCDKKNNPLMRRTIAANRWLGKAENAEAVAKFAADENRPDVMRELAIATLAEWSKPAPNDPVLNTYRPIEERDAAIVTGAARTALPSMLAHAKGDLQASVTKLAAALNIPMDDDTLLKAVADATQPPAVRVESIKLLAQRKSAKLPDALPAALKDDNAKVRTTARVALFAYDAGAAINDFKKALNGDNSSEKQMTFAALATLDSPAADDLILGGLDDYLAGKLDPAAKLDVVEAARARHTDAMNKKLDALSPKLAMMDFALEGGDPAAGREVFAAHPVAECMRCHKIDNEGGEAGPDLSHVASRGDRAYFLESLMNPSAKIAQGFETVIITTTDDATIAGTLRGEDAQSVSIAQADGKIVKIEKTKIKTRSAAPVSAMPPLAMVLKPEELRDVIAYLASRK